MTSEVSKTQIDRLGDRLRKGNITEADLRLLDTYRRLFTEAYEVVVIAIREELGLEPTGRPAKSTTSISDKLRRESIRLTQIQDIAGCRLITPDINAQDSVVQSLTQLFEHTTVVDRRQQPSHGYRAVHVIVNLRGKLIEIQVRTALQHIWAELSEKFSDVFDPAIKYGGGDNDAQKQLLRSSSTIAREESLEIEVAAMYLTLSSQNELTDKKKKELIKIQERVISLRKKMLTDYRNIIKSLEETKGRKDAVSD
jgi:ppGpp synthetase/RelA/SpoT-type nucleotidyltranferase